MRRKRHVLRYGKKKQYIRIGSLDLTPKELKRARARYRRAKE